MTMKQVLVAFSFSVAFILADALSQQSANKQRSAIKQHAAEPLSVAVKLLTKLEGEVTADQAAEAESYRKYSAYCEATLSALTVDLKSATGRQTKLTAYLEAIKSALEENEAKVEERAAEIAGLEKEIKSNDEIRAEEHKAFLTDEEDLVKSVDMLKRSYDILEKEMAKNPAALAQISKATSVESMLQTLGLVVEAAGLSAQDHKKLLAMVQENQSDKNDQEDGQSEAPAADAYKSKSSQQIVDMLMDLYDQAKAQLKDLRDKEFASYSSTELMKTKLKRDSGLASEAIESLKKEASGLKQGQADNEGDLERVKGEVATHTKDKADLTQDCAQKKSDHAASVSGFQEELTTIKKAIGILEGLFQVDAFSTTTPPPAASFLQLDTHSKGKTAAELASSEVIAFISKIAKQYHSSALYQLTSQISTVYRLGALVHDDPFEKVRGLISDLIEKLEAQKSQEASEKAQCDKDLEYGKKQAANSQRDFTHMEGRLDTALSTIAAAEERVTELNGQIAAMDARAVEMLQLREGEKAEFLKVQSDLNQGIKDVQEALESLRQYYDTAPLVGESTSTALPGAPAAPETHTKSKSKAAPVIDILLVCISDFTKDLTEKQQAEEDAQNAYVKEEEEIKVKKSKTSLNRDAEQATLTATRGTIESLERDKEQAKSALDAAQQYLAEVQGAKACNTLPESYAAKKTRREAEIAGLQKAVELLEELSGASLLQQGSHKPKRHGIGLLQKGSFRRNFRGVGVSK